MMLIGGVIHGPYFQGVFRALDHLFGAARTLRPVLAKSIVGQLTFAPFYVAMFYGAVTGLSGGSLNVPQIGAWLPRSHAHT